MNRPGHVAVMLWPFLGATFLLLYKMTQNDIRYKRRAETALQESEAGYRSILDSMNDAIFVHGLVTGKPLGANLDRRLEMSCHRRGRLQNYHYNV
ncbi:MAG TPA: hypothetical protein VK463_07020 [Desulfomonilaceae bacterium]|nr:hypothetical protein [Desulfomonilaceae bacterium]